MENNKVTGVVTSLGIEIKAHSVVLTNGTFLNGLIHVGDKQLGEEEWANQELSVLRNSLFL